MTEAEDRRTYMDLCGPGIWGLFVYGPTYVLGPIHTWAPYMAYIRFGMRSKLPEQDGHFMGDHMSPYGHVWASYGPLWAHIRFGMRF